MKRPIQLLLVLQVVCFTIWDATAGGLNHDEPGTRSLVNSSPQDKLNCVKELTPLIERVNPEIKEESARVKFSGDLTRFMRNDGGPLTEDVAAKLFEAAGSDHIRLAGGCQAFHNLELADCPKRIAYLKEKFSKAEGPRPFYAKISASTAKVVFIGEAHDHKTGQDYLPGLICEMKKTEPSFDCLFIEVSSPAQNALDAFLDGKATVSDVITTAGNPGGIYPKILETAKALGLRIFAMDAARGSDENRDQHMASVLMNHQNTCRKSIVHVGRNHLLGAHSLAARTCRTVSCHKVMMSSRDDEAISQARCQKYLAESLTAPTEPTAFATGGVDKIVSSRDPSLVFDRELTKHYSDFDSVLLVP